MVLREWDWLRDQVAPRGVALDAVIAADDENLDLARQYGFAAVECENNRMGRKWNAGFRYAAYADIAVLIGSDDWIHPDAFDRLPENAVSAARPLDFVDLERGVLQHASGNGLIPWLIPRSLLEPSNFAPFPDRMQRGTEPILIHALGHPPVVHRACTPGVDFKSADSTSPYAGVANSIGDGAEHDAWETLSRDWPGHLVQAAKEIA